MSIIENSVKIKLQDYIKSIKNGKLISSRYLKRKILHSMSIIRKYYKTIVTYNKLNKSDGILIDNYYRIEDITAKLIKSLKNVSFICDPNDKLPQIFKFMKEALNTDSFRYTTKTTIELIDIFSQYRLVKNQEFDFLKNFIEASIVITLAGLIRQGNFEEKSNMVSHVVITLFDARKIEFDKINQLKNPLENILSKDKSEIYLKQNDKTRNLYRYMVAKTAEIQNEEEDILAQKIIDESQNNHVGFKIYEYYNKAKPKNKLKKYYFRLQFIIPLIVSILLSKLMGNILFSILIYFPIYEIVKCILERLLSFKTECSYPPRLELEGDVPKELQTLVVISTLLPNENELENLYKKLEHLILTNYKGEIAFCLLADLKSAKEPYLEEDKKKIAGVKDVIKRLNKKYDNKTVLIVRNRQYSKTQDEYTGYERKRGAITDLISLIKGNPQDLAEIYGNTEFLYQTKYILTLDYDTKLSYDCVSDLVSIAAHPLNQPNIDIEKGIVTKGYGIIAPRIITDLKSSIKTHFSMIMGGVAGTSTYDCMTSEFYQDQCSESIFSGKGLIDVNVYHKLLHEYFEEETVLSHDILEGSMIRTLYAGDIELADNFPSDATSFFKRLHRWVRGDFQNVQFMFSKVILKKGKVKNPFNKVSKYKIFDNLRRELTPFFILLCLIFALFFKGKTSLLLISIGLISFIFPYVFSLLTTGLLNTLQSFATRFYSKIFPTAIESCFRMILNFLLLPQFAYIGVDGGIRGIYRRYYSKKKMLEWATAHQVEKQNKSYISEIQFYYPQILIGLIFILFGNLFLKIIGILFILTILVIHFIKKDRKKPIVIPDYIRNELTNDVKKMINFYNDFAVKSEHYLPPDNVQQAPVYRIAHRTSPTNIGLMLLSYLTERDFEFTDSSQLYNKISRVILTVKDLEKFHGNLYNWYDTHNLSVLPNRFVSTVDSGNFVCCLIALKEGLKEYSNEENKLPSLIEDIEKLIEETDLSIFYNKKLKLLSIGYDSEAERLSLHNYDMLMSESRMTSYFAIAKRQIPIKHWKSLSRTVTRTLNHAGPISWTGTMFEYFMPELLLHCIEGSMGYEGLKYCVYCQKRRVKGLDIPYGISESGIYSFDHYLNYQYLANGVQKIALKRGMEENLVISPYSSYLTLGLDLFSAYENIQDLKEMYVDSEYGPYEAVDYTRSRIGNSEFMVVKSHMAHHVGMSILGINNSLNENIMQRRFLNDVEMNSLNELLNEKISVGELVFKDLFKKKDKNKKNHKETVYRYVGHLFPQSPKVKLFNNSEITSVLTDLGVSYIKSNKTDIFRKTNDILKNPKGIFCYINLDNKVFSTTYAPCYNNDISYETAFSESSVLYKMKTNKLSVKTKVMLHQVLAVEEREITFTNHTNEELSFPVIIYAEPTLFPHIDDYSHQSFAKLFLYVKKDKDTDTIICGRKKRGNEEIFYASLGFKEKIQYELESNRENLFERTNVLSVKLNAFTDKIEETPGIPDACIGIRTVITLSKKESKTITLLTSVSKSKKEAIYNIIKTREIDNLNETKLAMSRFINGSLEERIAEVILPQILFSKRDSSNNLNAISKNNLPPNRLWQFGISADFPIVLCEIFSVTDIERIKAYVDSHSLLKECFIEYDLIFLYHDEQAKQIIEEIVDKDYDKSILCSRAGIHILDKNQLSDEMLNLLHAIACHIATRSLVRIEAPTKTYSPIIINAVSKPQLKKQSDIEVYGGSFIDNSFYVTGNPKLPWSHILANSTFGTLLSDKALGFTWAINARENKLTPWYNDTMRDNQGEMLILNDGYKYYDIINGSLAEFNPKYARYHAQIDNLEVKTTVKVPSKGMIKYIEIELINHSDVTMNVDITYYIEPILNVTRDNSREIKGVLEDNVILLDNTCNMQAKGFMALSCDHEEFDFCCDRPSFFNGEFNQNTLPPMQDICTAITVKKVIKPNSTEKIVFMMAFSATKQGALSLIKLKPNDEYVPENKIQISSKDKSVDLLINTWLPHQIIASRINGRTGFYQCGGAYGFRDQLQDVLAYVLISPKTARQHIIRCCAVQFEEGDVFHWWHILPKSGSFKRGVRTHYSDDLVWLPYVVSEYINHTNDYSILDVKVKYITSNELRKDQKDDYIEARYTDYSETVYEHCVRALKRAYNLGEHKLPKIGSGDWNDGYSNVGIEDKGESIWLSQFLSLTMKKFSKIAEYKNDETLTQYYKDIAKSLLDAVEEYGYDENYYIRAYYDNGNKMGCHLNDECKIDSLPQSFSVIAGMENNERIDSSLNTAYNNLVDSKNGIIKLFTPAFDKSNQEPGYVMAYPKGIRENGGQYTHAAIWFAIAHAMYNMDDKFFELVDLLNPIKKCQNEELAKKYMIEPYYIAADIYTSEYAYGRGGWSMYTGSSGWYYILLLEYYFGLKFNGEKIVINPKLPLENQDFTADIKYNGKNLKLSVKNGSLIKEKAIDINSGDMDINI